MSKRDRDKELKQPQPTMETVPDEPVTSHAAEQPEVVDTLAPAAADTVHGEFPAAKPAEKTMPESPGTPPPPPDDEEIYEVPPKLTGRDIAGVVVALVALAVIGVAGYIWLTPGLTFTGILQRGSSTGQAATTADSETTTAGADELRCDYCNMFVDRSAGAVYVEWSDGSGTSHDSWDCVFNTASERGLTIHSAQVVDFSTFGGEGNPEWLDAGAAAYLYDVSSVSGSMPPYVAAFASADAALSAQADLGGKLVDYAGLLAAFGYETTEPDTAEETPSVEPEHVVTAEPAPAPEPVADTSDTMADDPAPVADDPAAHDHDLGCPYCGMPAGNSLSHIEATWTDGTHTHHDSWDCVFLHAAENGLELAAARVLAYDDAGDPPQWLDADGASYLFDTQRIKGSMPPYVAAFDSPDAAAVAQPELGGEILDFTGLKARWNQ